MTIETIKRIMGQTVPPTKVVIVGSAEVDIEIPNLIDVDYLHVSNNPLGKKIQEGVEYCRQFEPDALLMCGSDDWLSPNWIDVFIPRLGEFDIVGADCLYVILFSPKELVEVKRCSYEGTERDGEPVGPGRLLSRKILDKMDWQLYSKDLNSSLDINSFRRLKEAEARILVEKNDVIKVLSPKGDWSTINNWECYTNFGKSMDEPEEWLEKHFPDALKTLCRLTDTKLEVGIMVQPNLTRMKIWGDYANT